MSDIREGQVFRWFQRGRDRIERILLSIPGKDAFVVFAFVDDSSDANPGLVRDEAAEAAIPSLPFERSKSDIEQNVEEGNCRPESDDVWAGGFEPRNEAERKVRDEISKLLQVILKHGNSFLFPEQRGTVIDAALEECRREDGKKWGKGSAYRFIRRYWKSNGNINALTPGFRTRGGKGTTRFLTKKNSDRYFTTELDRVWMMKALEEKYLKEAKPSIEDVFNYLLGKYYKGKTIGEHPSKSQLRRVLRKVSPKRLNQKREGSRKRNKDLRPKLGSIRDLTAAPGDRCEIDSTPLPVDVVCEINRSLVVGQPNLYLAGDVFCGGPCGWTVSLDTPSIQSVALAIEHSISDKDEYFQRIGVRAKPGSVPMKGLHKLYVADGAELDTTYAENLKLGLNTEVEIIAGYRPDWKGMVEMLIGMICRYCRLLLGYKKKRARGEKDSKLFACLTLNEVERIVARAMILLWKRVREYNQLDRQMLEENVFPSPLKMYEWGAAKRGNTRAIAKEIVRLNTFRRGVAWVTQHGIKFGRLHYTCPRAEKEEWFDKAAINGWDVPIAYHSRYVNQIYLVNNDQITKIEPCDLTPGDSVFKDASFADVDLAFQEYRKVTRAYAEGELRDEKVEFHEFAAQIQASAKTAHRQSLNETGLSDNARKQGVVTNREKELKRLRQEAAANALPQKSPQTEAPPKTNSPQGSVAGEVAKTNSAPRETYAPRPDNMDVLEQLASAPVPTTQEA